MQSYFSPEFFIGNRQQLRRLFTGRAPIIITAQGVLQRSGDNTFPFRQDSSFWYLTGITDPGLVLVMDRDTEYLIVPTREKWQIIFDGATDTQNLSRRSGIETILEEEVGWKKLNSRLKHVQHAATLAAPAAYLASHTMYTNPARARLIARLKEVNPHIELLDLRQHLSVMRTIKQKAELQAIKAAIAITESTLLKVSRHINKYAFEYQIEADITREFRIRGALGNAFSPIIAGGKNASTIHYMANTDALKAGDLILIDVGAEVEQYNSDITRTYAFGKVNKRHQAVYAAVAAAVEFATSQLKPGIMLKEFEIEVEHFVGEKLRELNLIKLIDHENVRRYFPYSTSHFLGIDLHDAGDYDRPLEPGTVLTVEPGIHIPEEGIGVRIEDDILITKQGVTLLSKRLPHWLK